MEIELLRAKIHRATVTDAHLDYVGSITIDSEIIAASGLIEYEKVQVVNINNGQRFETYVIAGTAGQKEMCINGAAARLCQVNDKIIVIAYAKMSLDEAKHYQPTSILLDDQNNILRKL